MSHTNIGNGLVHGFANSTASNEKLGLEKDTIYFLYYAISTVKVAPVFVTTVNSTGLTDSKHPTSTIPPILPFQNGFNRTMVTRSNSVFVR